MPHATSTNCSNDLVAVPGQGLGGIPSAATCSPGSATDRAASLGLVLTELVINANKYAYGGAPGPLRVTLMEDRNLFHLTVADQGVGRAQARKGFGTRMMRCGW